MTISNFFRQLNWRQVGIHFLAFWFFAFSFQTFAYLFDLPVSRILMQPGGQQAMLSFMKSGISPDRINGILKFASALRLIGIIAAFIVSLSIAIKQTWFWGSSVMALVILLFLNVTTRLGWPVLKYIFLTPGEIFSRNPVFYFAINGLILLVLGLLTFFLPNINRFIEKGRKITATPKNKKSQKAQRRSI